MRPRSVFGRFAAAFAALLVAASAGAQPLLLDDGVAARW